MKKKTYLIILYTSLAVFILGLALLIIATSISGELNAFSIIGLCLAIFSILTVVLNQCLYRIKKEEIETPKNQVKVCPKCNTPNDLDAEYCKICGTKFKNF